MADRWEIRESELNPALIAKFGDLGPHFAICDTVAGRQIAFGGFSSREQAQTRIDRMDPADYCTGCARHVAGMGRSDCPTPAVHRG